VCHPTSEPFWLSEGFAAGSLVTAARLSSRPMSPAVIDLFSDPTVKEKYRGFNGSPVFFRFPENH
jgi:hypothetical protein